MKDSDRIQLAQVTVAPYIQKATALIGLARRVGGNQFRHAMATMAILIDYGVTDPVLLKAAVIHDLFEDVPGTPRDKIAALDSDGPAVADLVLEVSRRPRESKTSFLERVRETGSAKAKLLKVADRISNLTDLNTDDFASEFIGRYLEETIEFIYPMADEVNRDMAVEIRDLVRRKQAQCD